MKVKNRDRKVASAAPARLQTPLPSLWPYVAGGLAAIVAVFWAYGPSLHAPFLFDDATLPFALPGVSDPLSVWLRGVRPVLMATYWLNSRISGDDPYSYHVLNIFIHLVASGLIFAIVRRLLEWSGRTKPQTTLLAAFAGLVFLLHPVQAEAVAYLAGRSEAFSVTLVLAAFAVFLYRKETSVTWSTVAIVLALFGAALLSKEHTVVLPALLLLTDYWWNPGFSLSGVRKNYRLYIAVALGAVAGIVFFANLILHSSSAGFQLKDFTWYQYFFTQCRALFVYPAEFLFPIRLTADWDFPISHTIFDHQAIVGLLALLVLVAAAWRYRRQYPLACFGFLVYLVLMAPTSSILPIQDPIAERRLYFSMLGLLLIVVDVMARIKVPAKTLAAAATALLLVLAGATYVRASVWSSPISLWQDTAVKSPHKRRVHYQLASAYVDAGRCAEAIPEYQAAAALRTDYNVLIDWAMAYDCMNRIDPALAKMREAAAMEPTAHVYSQIAMIYAKRSMWSDALDALAKAEALDPNYPHTYVYRADIQTATNQIEPAIVNYRRALQLDPSLETIVRPKLAQALRAASGH